MFNELFNAAMADQMPGDMEEMMKAMMGGGGGGADMFQQFEQFAKASTSTMPGKQLSGNVLHNLTHINLLKERLAVYRCQSSITCET